MTDYPFFLLFCSKTAMAKVSQMGERSIFVGDYFQWKIGFISSIGCGNYGANVYFN